MFRCRQPQEFLQQCLGQSHPFDLCKGVPDSLLRVMGKILLSGPVQVMKALAPAEKVRRDEDQACRRGSRTARVLGAGVAKILQGKSLLLLEQIASDLDWPDASLHQELRESFRITGMSRPSGAFDLSFKPPDLSEAELAAKTKFMKPAIWARVRSEVSNQHAQALLEPNLRRGG